MVTATGRPASAQNRKTSSSRRRNPAFVSASRPSASPAKGSAPLTWITRSARARAIAWSSPAASRSRYSVSPAPSGRSRSRSLRSLRNGKLRAPWIEKVKCRGSSRRIAAVPLPWCTSVSTTSTRGPSRSSAAIALSLNTQYPWPQSGPAWCVPPAMLTPTPSSSAAWHAASVAPAERRERSTRPGLHGNPMRRTSIGVSAPVTTRSRYPASWARRICASVAASGRCSVPSPATRSRSRRYFAIGKRWPSGSGSSKTSV